MMKIVDSRDLDETFISLCGLTPNSMTLHKLRQEALQIEDFSSGWKFLAKESFLKVIKYVCF